MPRDLAGRIFVFQDRLQTPAHFTKLQNLLRDPQQLLHDDYTRLLHKSQVPLAPPHLRPNPYPHPHPALQTAQPQQPNPRDGPPPLQRAPASAPSISQVQHLLPPVRHHPSPQAATAPPSRSAEPEQGAPQSTHGASEIIPKPSPASSSIYDQALPVPIVIDDEDDDAAAASDGDRDDHGDEANNAGGNDSGKRADNSSAEKHDDNQNATPANDETEDEDEQRPAKRRRQESVAEE
jgi:hypothetical protein